MDFRTYFRHYPDENGFFGPYGGCYVPEELQNALKEIAQAYQTIAHSAQFINELRRIRREFQGRPTPVYHCERLSRMMGSGGCQIYLKREDLNHTGAHKMCIRDRGEEMAMLLKMVPGNSVSSCMTHPIFCRSD